MDKTRGGSMDYSFEDLMNLAHKEGITLFNHNDTMVPCILVTPERFDEIAKACYGKPLGIDANLNILHDDQKHVFVEILLKFSSAGLEHKVLLYANENLQFFEHLAESGIIALAPKSVGQASMNIFMVQLPRRDAAEKALELIKSYLQ
ncbi:MAG: hypothetical protein ACRD38_06845 [Nitrososphaerales archaeon]